MHRRVLVMFAVAVVSVVVAAMTVSAGARCNRGACKEAISACEDRHHCHEADGRDRSLCRKDCAEMVLVNCDAGFCDCSAGDACSPAPAFLAPTAAVLD